MVKRFPDTGILKWKDQGVRNELTGTYTEGAPKEATVRCRLIPNGGGRYVPGSNEMVYQYHISADRITDTITGEATFEVNGRMFPVKHLFTDQLRTQIWV